MKNFRATLAAGTLTAVLSSISPPHPSKDISKLKKGNYQMRFKLLLPPVLAGLTIAALGICPLVFAQPNTTPAPALSPSAQTTPAQQMQGMDSMNQIAEMCQKMMKQEEAAMPYIIGIFAMFGLLIFVALVLFVVLEILGIKYWGRKLRCEK